MIKYRQLTRSAALFELISNRLKRKAEFNIKKIIVMSRIIQKIQVVRSKLNYFDLLFILLLFIVFSFFIYNRLQRKTTWINVRIAVENSDWWYKGLPPNYWYAKDLDVGDSVIDSFGNKAVEIVGINNYDSGGPYRDIYVDLKIRTDYDKKKDQHLYEFKPLVVGSSLLFNFPKSQLRGVVIGVDEQNEEYFYKTIKVEKKYVLPSLVEQIQVGDIASDAQDNEVAEVLGVNSGISSYYEFSDQRGKKIKVYDPNFRDIEVTLRIKSFNEFGIDYYINKAALKIGNSIWFQFPKYALEDVKIIEIIE